MPKGEAIPLTACEHRRLYVLHSRNLRCGVYSAPHRGFFGIRTKFSYRHVAVEYHVDTGAPYGTACPLKALDAVAPNEIDLVETVLTRPGDPGFDPTIADGRMYHETRTALFSWLEDQARQFEKEITDGHAR